MKAAKRLWAAALAFVLLAGCGKPTAGTAPAASAAPENQEQPVTGLLTAWDGRRYYTKANVICDSADMTARDLVLQMDGQRMLSGYPVTDGKFLYYSTETILEAPEHRTQIWRSGLDGSEPVLLWQSEAETGISPVSASLNGWSDNIGRLVVFAWQDAVWFFIRQEGWIDSPQVLCCGNGETQARPVEYPEPLAQGTFAGEMDDQPVFQSFEGERCVYWQLDLATGTVRELADFPEPVHSNLLVQDGILYLQDDESWELCAVDLASGERQVLWRPGEPDQGLGVQYVWDDHAFLMSVERPLRYYSLDLNDGSTQVMTLRGKWESDGREFVVYAKAPLEDSYVVVCRRNEFIGIGMSQAGEPERSKETREYYALIKKEDFWNSVPEYRYFTWVDGR